MNLCSIIQNIHLRTPKLPRPMGFTTQGGHKLIKSIPVSSKGSTFYMQTVNDNYGQLATTIRSKLGCLLGKHTFILGEQGDVLGNYMETKPKYRKNGIGELLSLANVIMMKENHSKEISFLSLPEAIPFHAKYKFKPVITDSETSTNILDKIRNNDAIDSDTRKKAENLFMISKYNPFSEKNRVHMSMVNELVCSYIDKYKDNWAIANFNHGVEMKLTSEDVKTNSDFFNGLFKKHKIDYSV